MFCTWFLVGILALLLLAMGHSFIHSFIHSFTRQQTVIVQCTVVGAPLHLETHRGPRQTGSAGVRQRWGLQATNKEKIK